MSTVYTRTRVNAYAVGGSGSEATPIPAHDDAAVLVRSTHPIWLRFGASNMGAAGANVESILYTGGENVVQVPEGATHFRARRVCFYSVPLQLEGIAAIEPPPAVYTWTPNTPTSLPIVPGGAGFAMYQDACFGRAEASGGLARAWKHYAVTTLASSGPGSLRDACLASGPRIVTFWVSGVIDLHDLPDDDRDIKIVSGDLYIAGETAPAPGIILYGAQLVVDVNKARNVVLSHFANFQYPYIDKKKQDSRGDCLDTYVDDGVSSAPGGNLLSANMCYAWGNDELASVYKGCEDFSFYQSVFAEGLNNTDNLEGEPHGFGPYVNCESLRRSRGDFNRCVMMHTKERNPATCVEQFSIINCLDFDCFNRGVMICNQFGVDTHTNVEGCIFLDGPSGKKDAIFVQNSGGNEVSAASKYYIAENRAIGYDESKLVTNASQGTMVSTRIASAWPPGAVLTKIGDRREDFTRLVARHCGPWPGARQPAIDRFMQHIEARLTGEGDQGGMVDYPEDVGGMPALASNKVDHTQGDDPIPGVTSSSVQTVGEDARRICESHYTNFEEWLDRKRARIMPSDTVRIESTQQRMRRRAHR